MSPAEIDVKWYKNDEEILANEKFVINREGGNVQLQESEIEKIGFKSYLKSTRLV